MIVFTSMSADQAICLTLALPVSIPTLINFLFLFPSVAFDPIFFLHHANVDRMLSLWSALNPDVWVSKGDSEDGTFTLAPGIQIDATTGMVHSLFSLQSIYLIPFWLSIDTILE